MTGPARMLGCFAALASAVIVAHNGRAQEPRMGQTPTDHQEPQFYAAPSASDDLFEFWLSSPSPHYFLQSRDLTPRWLESPTARIPLPLATSLDYGWTARDGSDGFGTNDVYLNTSLIIPLLECAPLVFSPGFAFHLWDGPDSLDLPGQVYDAMGRLTMRRVFSERWAFEFGAAVGVFSDFQHSDSDALRVVEMVVGQYQWSPKLKLEFGAACRHQSDQESLLVAGLRWMPREDLDIRIGSPVTRISQRIAYSPCGPQWWAYGEAVFDGGEWAVQRPDGRVLPVEYRSLQLKLGLERRVENGLMTYFEVAYGLERKIEIDDEGVDRDLGDTLSLRAGVMF